MNVLIVDDEPLARSRLRRLLAELPETAQAAVDEAADAAEAWVLLRAQRFDVLLLDIQMPGQTGMELARRLTGDPGLHHPAIVFVTAHEDKAVAAFDETRLNEVVPGREYPFYVLLHGAIDHALYHAGQIEMLMVAQGLRPAASPMAAHEGTPLPS